MLRDELRLMEEALHGAVRPEIAEYVEAFRGFLERHGDTSDLEAEGAGATAGVGAA